MKTTTSAFNFPPTFHPPLLKAIGHKLSKNDLTNGEELLSLSASVNN